MNEGRDARQGSHGPSKEFITVCLFVFMMYVWGGIFLVNQMKKCVALFLGDFKVKVTQLCPTFCDPMDYTVDGILQARILEWVTYPFSRGSPQPRNQTQISCIAGRFFTS